MTHAIGTIAMAQSLVSGFELVVDDIPHGLKPLDWIIETGTNYVMGVPTHAIDLLSELRRRGGGAFGAKPGEVENFLHGRFGDSARDGARAARDEHTIEETCGAACPGYEVKIWHPDNTDEELAATAVFIR